MLCYFNETAYVWLREGGAVYEILHDYTNLNERLYILRGSSVA